METYLVLDGSKFDLARSSTQFSHKLVRLKVDLIQTRKSLGWACLFKYIVLVVNSLKSHTNKILDV